MRSMGSWAQMSCFQESGLVRGWSSACVISACVSRVLFNKFRHYAESWRRHMSDMVAVVDALPFYMSGN
jgi:hypothetical protein